MPTLLVIGAMKCGTTALHRTLDLHPQIGMSRPKELNFFIGPDHPAAPGGEGWARGNWWRGMQWYAAQFAEGTRARGESSPGYTSPDHPEAAARIADVIPDVRLVYLVRDPIDRAVSQYEHHRGDGTETRHIAEALLDPASQYIARSRYHERLMPYLAHFPPGQILVVTQEDLRDHPASTLRRICAHVGVDTAISMDTSDPSSEAADTPERLDDALRCRLAAAVCDDVEALHGLLRHPPRWHTC